MRRDSKLLWGSIIVLITITLIGVLFATLDLMSKNSRNTTIPINQNLPTSAPTDNQLVIVNTSGAPVTVDRFGIIIVTESHQLLNAAAVDTTLIVSSAVDQTELGSLSFSGLGEMVELAPYRFRLINATANSLQLLISK